MKPSLIAHSDSLTMKMSKILRQTESRSAPLESLIRIAEQPQSQSGICKTEHSGILPVKVTARTMLLEIVKGYSLLQMRSSCSEFSQVIQSCPQYPMGLNKKRGVLCLLR